MDKKVLLVEQHQTFYHNDFSDFSSAATPMETLEKFKLPPEVIGSFGKKLAIVSTNYHQTWESNHPLIEIAESDYQYYANQLIFFLGHKCMPKGYSWIFPINR